LIVAIGANSQTSGELGAADARLPAAGWGPDRRIHLVVATTDPVRLPNYR
jgi:hypothetical protein